jgi:hypothetical protein
MWTHLGCRLELFILHRATLEAESNFKTSATNFFIIKIQA